MQHKCENKLTGREIPIWQEILGKLESSPAEIGLECLTPYNPMNSICPQGVYIF